MKLLITGSRNFTDYNALTEAIDDIMIGASCHYGEHEWIEEIWHGGAKGADQLAQRYADEHGIKCYVIRPDYNKHHPKAAPLKRNSDLVAATDATLALYGEGRSGKGGTADAARKSKAARHYTAERKADGRTTHTPPAAEQGTLW